MMFTHRPGEAGAGILEYLRPLIRIKLFSVNSEMKSLYPNFSGPP